jgi:hypothetical protein
MLMNLYYQNGGVLQELNNALWKVKRLQGRDEWRPYIWFEFTGIGGRLRYHFLAGLLRSSALRASCSRVK